MLTLDINGQAKQVDVEPDTPLLWVLRDTLGLTGTKFGCGIGACGACTVHLDGEAVRSCLLPAGALLGRRIVTIESLGDAKPHPVQLAWLAHQVPQCGYCQSGMIMAAAALLAKSPHPDDGEVDAALSNICRCGSYPRVRLAMRALASSGRSAA